MTNRVKYFTIIKKQSKLKDKRSFFIISNNDKECEIETNENENVFHWQIDINLNLFLYFFSVLMVDNQS
jgi:hypothetical protein